MLANPGRIPKRNLKSPRNHKDWQTVLSMLSRGAADTSTYYVALLGKVNEEQLRYAIDVATKPAVKEVKK